MEKINPLTAMKVITAIVSIVYTLAYFEEGWTILQLVEKILSSLCIIWVSYSLGWFQAMNQLK